VESSSRPFSTVSITSAEHQLMATTLYIRVKGTGQGTFKGEVNRITRGHDWSKLLAARFRDPANPLPSDEPEKPNQVKLQIAKTLGSTAFFRAYQDGETLSLVEIEFVRPDAKAGEIIEFSLRLNDVLVADYSRQDQGGGMTLEVMSLSYTSDPNIKVAVPPSLLTPITIGMNFGPSWAP
jgi:type VI protein secretion system component Hcp